MKNYNNYQRKEEKRKKEIKVIKHALWGMALSILASIIGWLVLRIDKDTERVIIMYLFTVLPFTITSFLMYLFNIVKIKRH